MGNINFIFTSILLLTSNIHFANDYIPDWAKNLPDRESSGSTHYGPTTIKNEKSENLTIFGPAKITSSDITGKVVLKGPVEAHDSVFNQVNITGIANLDGVKIKDLYMTGPLFANNSDFDNITITAYKIAFSNSRVKKLVVKNVKSTNEKVFLEKNSTIDSIVFENKDGVVVLQDKTSSVKNVEGGKVWTND